MKITIDKEELLEGLDTVTRIVSTNNTLPILDNVLIEAKKDKNTLHLTCTNLEVAIKKSVEAKVDMDGKLTLPAKFLYSFVGLVKDGDQIVFEQEEKGKCKIYTKESDTDIRTLNPEDFPVVPQISSEALKFKISAKEFTEGVSKTLFSVSNNNIRPTLSGVYVYTTDTELYFASTDIYRLSEYKIAKPSNITDINIIIPSKSLFELIRLFSKDSGDINCSVDKNQIVFEKEGVVIISRLIEGKFPDYKKIIPSGKEVTAIISKNELQRIIKRVNLFAKDNNFNVKIKIDPENEEFVISSEGSELGKQISKVQCNVEGKEVGVALNSQYVLDFLQTVDNDTIEVEATSKLVAVVFRPEKSENFTHLIMPLKID